MPETAGPCTELVSLFILKQQVMVHCLQLKSFPTIDSSLDCRQTERAHPPHPIFCPNIKSLSAIQRRMHCASQELCNTSIHTAFVESRGKLIQRGVDLASRVTIPDIMKGWNLAFSMSCRQSPEERHSHSVGSSWKMAWSKPAAAAAGPGASFSTQVLVFNK